MKIFKLALRIACSAFLIIAAGCGGSSDWIAVDFQDRAQKALADHSNTVSFSSFTTFKWDKVFIFGPYTPEENIDTELGFKWSSRAKARLAESDGEFLVVFIVPGKTVLYCEFSRKFGDFSSSGLAEPFIRGRDIFTVTTNRDRFTYSPVATKAKPSP